MKIQFFANLRQITGKSQLQWTRPAATLADLLSDLVDQYGPRFREIVLDGDELSRLAIILINGRDARGFGGLAAPLSAQDDICIFPPVAGG